jgi:hypothetical protein
MLPLHRCQVMVYCTVLVRAVIQGSVAKEAHGPLCCAQRGQGCILFQVLIVYFDICQSAQGGSPRQATRACHAAASGTFESSTMGEEAAAADDFVLYSSQTYERVLSQQVLCEHVSDADATQDGLTQTQFLPDAARQPSQCYPAQAEAAQPMHSSDSQELDEQVPRRVSNASTCTARTTPGMRTDEEASCNAGPAKLFPVFRTRRERKVLQQLPRTAAWLPSAVAAFLLGEAALVALLLCCQTHAFVCNFKLLPCIWSMAAYL